MKYFAYILFVTLCGPALGASFFATSFDDPALDPNLQDPSGAYSIDDGRIGLIAAGNRSYIRTIDTDYNTVDFRLIVNYYHTELEHANVFVGIGQADPDPAYYGEPTYAACVNQFNYDWHWVGCQFTVRLEGSDPPYIFNVPLARSHDFSTGYMHVEIKKVGDELWATADAGEPGGSDVYEFGPFSLTNDLSHLNSTNSHLFFGTDDTTVTFANMEVTDVFGPGCDVLASDLNTDCKTDLADLAILFANWLECSDYNDPCCWPPLVPD